VVLATAAILCTAAGARSADPPSKATVTAAGLQIETATGVLSLEPWAQNIIHVRFAVGATWSNPYNSWVISKPVRLTWTVDEVPDSWVLKTGALQARVRKRDGASASSIRQVLFCSRRARKRADFRSMASDPWCRPSIR
jgi:hypothetical protein